MTGKKYFLKVIYQKTKMIWSYFLNKKYELGETTINLIKDLKIMKVNTKYIRMDNGGENLELETHLRNEKLNIQVEYTPRETPQHNRVVERSFQTLYNRIREIINGDEIYGSLRFRVLSECSNTATVLYDTTVKKDKSLSP